MKGRHVAPDTEQAESLPPLPLTPQHWQAVIERMGLSPREAEVAALKVRGAQLKEMAAILGIEVTSVRCFQDRICAKAGIRRHEFFAHVLRLSHEVACPPNRGHTAVDTKKRSQKMQ